ncbi:MAG: tetratricopeptide repeat protein [Rhodocyclaceae bacterium]|nr:tetratricopeptide repeat protein [Rhodocyclaceae bacterium]
MRCQLLSQADPAQLERYRTFYFEWFDRLVTGLLPTEVGADAEVALVAAWEQAQNVLPPKECCEWLLERCAPFDRCSRHWLVSPLLEGAVAMLANVGQTETAIGGRVVYKLGIALKGRADYAAAEDSYRRALDIRSRAFGLRSMQAADVMHDLGVLLYTIDRNDESEKFLLEALSIRQEVCGPASGAVGTSLSNLAALYFRQDRLEEARSLYREALSLRRNGGISEGAIASTLEGLGRALARLGEFDEAETAVAESLEIRTRCIGPSSAPTASSLHALGELKLAEGQLQAAREALGRAYELRALHLGLGHPLSIETAALLGTLGASV